MIDNSVFEEPIASKLAELRRTARTKRRLTYDCMNAIVTRQVVQCCKQHKLWSCVCAGISLLSVLRGRSSQVCQKCADYNGEVTE